jgi:Methyltransferase domain
LRPKSRLGDATTRLADRLLRRGLERLSGSGPVFVPEFPLGLSARWGWDGRPSLQPVARLLEEGRYEGEVDAVCELLEWARTIPRAQQQPGDPCWENSYWGTIDALMQCAALRARDPALYLEIGSGYSTLFARRAITDFGLRTRIVSIDPHPRADVDARCDEIIRRPMEDVEHELFDRLGPDDVLFMDGSHVALMGSDATVFFLEVLPRLAPGVLVGIDDIFLPWDYPPSWTGRIYGEQYLLAALLLGGAQGWSVRFPGWWLVEESELAARFEPLWPLVENRFGRHAASFWLERT